MEATNKKRQKKINKEEAEKAWKRKEGRKQMLESFKASIPINDDKFKKKYLHNTGKSGEQKN